MQRSQLWLLVPLFVIVLTLLLWAADKEMTSDGGRPASDAEYREMLLEGLPRDNGLSPEENKALERKLLEGLPK